MSALTLDSIKHCGATAADDTGPQIINNCAKFTLDLKQLGLVLQTLGSWFPNDVQDYWAMDRFFLSLVQEWKMLLVLSLNQEWLDTGNATFVARFLDTSVHGGPWCSDSSLGPLLVKLFLSWINLTILSRLRSSLLCTIFYHALAFQLTSHANVLLWHFVYINGLRWLSLLLEGVSECLLDKCQVCTLSWHCDSQGCVNQIATIFTFWQEMCQISVIF